MSAPAVHAVLIHGMGRTPASMLVLAARLRRGGLSTSLFGYSATFENFTPCVARLAKHIRRHVDDTTPFILVSHSLGAVLARTVIPVLPRAPLACVFLAPPTVACRIARAVAPRRVYRAVAGQMGQLLSEPAFMQSLPPVTVPTTIVAGDDGPRGRWSPFGEASNDGILTVDETRLEGATHLTVPAWHTFIMNRADVSRIILDRARQLAAAIPAPAQPTQAERAP
jgi:pimeloyl-ACP methyl ester carboxylesterase